MNIDKFIRLDIECYPNYTLVMFSNHVTGKIIYFEKYNGGEISRANILHIVNKYTIVTFNGIKYDILIIEAIIAGFSNKTIYMVNQAIIENELQPWQVRKQFGFPALEIDHIDLIEVAPLRASLKIYGGRLHTKKMQDLPIEPGTIITDDVLPEMRKYCGNDLEVTGALLNQLIPELELRCKMSETYGVDLRSKSDAQIAEHVIKQQLNKKYGINAKRPKIESGTLFKFHAPSNLSFTTDLMREIFDTFKTSNFKVGKTGHMELPKSLHNKKIVINKTTYKIGIGGLHSCEKSISHVSDDNYILRDYDVESYYPRIIVNNNLTPKHLGSPFLDVYQSLIKERLHAKATGNKPVNESLKITINGSFGKLSSKWSLLYAPDLMMHVTVIGQLTLLMLIERLEVEGIQVVSANTDGIVVRIPRDDINLVEDIVDEWEFDTDFKMESTEYLSLNSRDVNNYIAVKPAYTGKDGKLVPKSTKSKGAYCDQTEHYNMLRNNPNNSICSTAVKEYLMHKTPIQQTVMDCKDIRRFITIRTVNGGAVKDGIKIGKAIRWYYGEGELDCIRYSTNNNKVPKTDGAIPLMELPSALPKDIDYEWYIASAKKILKEIGYKITLC